MSQSWAQLPAPCMPGQIGGHEGVGKVAAVGPGVLDTGVQVGDRVGIKWINSACGNCRTCSLPPTSAFTR
jgi:alcohol dehydrogenase, propanol-preferring